jgi:hypothetical protein
MDSLILFLDSLILFMASLSSSLGRLLQQTKAGPFENWAVNGETPIVTSYQHRKDSILLRDISVVESRIFATLLIGEGNLQRGKFTASLPVIACYWFLHSVVVSIKSCCGERQVLLW